MADRKGAHRRRGVRASRERLTEALTAAGLRTQAALAERIAEIENLDAPPRDAVGRAFREQPVEVTTLARIAHALGVEAHSLYLTADDEAHAPLPNGGPAGPTRRARQWLVALPVLALLAGGGAWWFAGPADAPSQPAEAAAPILGLGQPTLVVLSIEGDPDGELADAVRLRLGESFKVAARSASVLTRELDPAGAAERLRSDAVIEGERVDVGHLSGLRFFLFANGVRQQVWAESLPTAGLPERLGQVADNVARAMRRAAGLPLDAPPGHFPLVPAQDDYLQGEYYLDRPSNELNVRRAQNRFEAALRQDANYARAHAGLCQGLLEEHWMSDEERALQDASRACGRALQLAPADPVVVAAHAHFLRRTGRNDEALGIYADLVAAEPFDTAALAGYASSLLTAYQQSGEHDFLLRAKATAAQAADADARVWKPLFALAAMEWFDGNVAGAIAASERARARDENEYVLANLGTFYMCSGDFGEARDAYLRAQDLAPESYVGDEFLGTAYYFLGDFAESARLRQRAIDSIAEGSPEIHEMWGALADSYRQLGQRDAAIEAYLHAAEILERDHLRGNAPVDDRAARAYYYTVLAQLDSSLVPATVAQGIAAELDEVASGLTSATARRRMAQTWLLRGERDKARAALELSMQTCPGFGEMPDLAALKTR